MTLFGLFGRSCAEGDYDEATHYCKREHKQLCFHHTHILSGCCELIPGVDLEHGYCDHSKHRRSTKYCEASRREYCDTHSHYMGCCKPIGFSRRHSFTRSCYKCGREIKSIDFNEHMLWHDIPGGAPQKLCPYCTRTDITPITVWNHIQWCHPGKDPGASPSKNGRQIVVIREDEEEERPYVEIPGEPNTAGEATDL